MTGFQLGDVHRAEPGKDRFKLSSTPMIIGRDPSANIHLTGHSISRHHAKVWVENENVVLEDLHSLNGVFVGGKPVKHVNLNSGDQFVIGRVIIEVASYETDTAAQTSL